MIPLEYLTILHKKELHLKRQARILIVSTMDTKAEEVGYLKDILESRGVKAFLLDAGIRGKSPVPVEISRDEVAAAAGNTLSAVQELGHEGSALNIMISGAIRSANELYSTGKINGILGIGGSMGTTLGTAVMQTFPVGFPKVMISTMASRNTRAFVGTKDIMMLHSVCDLAGLNRITKQILREGALAIAGMAEGEIPIIREERPLATLSTLGTTESCVVRLRQHLESEGMEAITFHTVGSGGEAMDELIRDGDVQLVIDLSLHELTDHFFGGDYDAGPTRGAAALEKGIPTILVPGNMDFLVTGPLEKAKKYFSGRRMHAHNAAITAVETNPAEMEHLAKYMADLCGKAKGPVAVIIPMGGFSAFDSPDGPLENPDGRNALAQILDEKLPQAVLFVKSSHHINDPDFAEEVISCIARIAHAQSK